MNIGLKERAAREELAMRMEKQRMTEQLERMKKLRELRLEMEAEQQRQNGKQKP